MFTWAALFLTDFSVGDIVFLFLFLVPGFLSLRTFIHVAKITETYDNIEKLAYILVGSGVSIAIIVLTYSLFSSVVVTVEVIQNFSLSQMSVGYIIHIILTPVLGYIGGRGYNSLIEPSERRSRSEAWDITFNDSPEETEVWVKTIDGREIRGLVDWYGTSTGSRDLLLKYPEWVLREENGEISELINMGEQVFIHEQDISQIYFAGEEDE